MIRNFFLVLICALALNAFEYRAYDIGGNEITSKSSIKLEAEEITLLPFSFLDIKKDDVNLDGDFTLLFGTVNGKKVEPIKLASNYKLQPILIKAFKNGKLVGESEELFLDKDVIKFSITIQKD
ncbi:MAG: hypothetical protein ACNI25_09060 [Halarcobacter sp.]